MCFVNLYIRFAAWSSCTRWSHTEELHCPLRSIIHQSHISAASTAPGTKAEERTPQIRPCWCWSLHLSMSVVVERCFEAGRPAYAQEDAFVHLFTIICCDRFSKAGGVRNPALWDKNPFVFNQSPAFNAKLFQMARVKWKGGLHRRGAFRNQIRPQNRNWEKEKQDKL